MRRQALSILRTLVLLVALAYTLVLARNTLLAWFDYGSHGVMRTDFALYYAFSRIGLTQGWASLYDLAAQRRVYTTMPGLWWFPLPYTPPMAWLTAPLTVLPLQTAYWVWTSMIAAAFVASWWLTSPQSPLLRALCLTAALAPYLTLLGVELGQFIVFELAGVALALWFLKRGWPAAAGLSLLLIDIHPQGFLLVPIALLMAAPRRALMSWLGGSAVLVAAAVVSLHFKGSEQYIGRLLWAERSPLDFAVAFSVDLPLMFHGRLLRLAVETLVAAVAAVAIWRHRRTSTELAFASALIGSTLVTSFIHLDDLMVLLLAAWICLKAQPAWILRPVVAAGAAIAILLDFDHVGPYGIYMVLFEVTWLIVLALLPQPAIERSTERATRALQPEPSARLAAG